MTSADQADQATRPRYVTLDDLAADYPDFRCGAPGPYNAHMRADNEFGCQGHVRVHRSLDGLAALMDEQREQVAAKIAAEYPGAIVRTAGGGEYRATDQQGNELARGTETNLRSLLPFSGL